MIYQLFRPFRGTKTLMNKIESVPELKAKGKLCMKSEKELRRGWEEKRRTIDYYDHIAPSYDELYRDEQKAKIDTTLHHISLSKEDVILDAGCGTGFLFKHISEKVKTLVGLDSSSGILKEAQKLAKSLSNAHLILADVDFMPFSEKVFDRVFAITLLQNLPNHLWTLSELKRVGKDDSIFAVTTFKKHTKHQHFGQTNFIALLNKAGFRVSVVENNRKLKDFIAICRPKTQYARLLREGV